MLIKTLIAAKKKLLSSKKSVTTGKISITISMINSNTSNKNYKSIKINVITGKLDLAKYIKFSTGEDIEYELGKGVSMILRLVFSEADREEDAELFANE